MSTRGSVALAAIALAMAACQSTPGASDAPAAASSPSASEKIVVRGQASYRERIKMPPGARIEVQLIDERLVDTAAAAVAQVALDDVAGPPYDFVLPVPRSRVRSDGRYGLHARLIGPDGMLWFVSAARVPVDLQHPAPVLVPMVRVAGEGETAQTTPAGADYWQCEDVRVSARYDRAPGQVELAFSGRRLTLPQAVSASGARYADDAGNEFWSKGVGGTLALAGEGKRDCAPADGPSPWDQAQARGVGFRAVGNEPGWSVEVGPGKAPTLHAELDYGERRVDVAGAQPLADRSGYRGRTSNGQSVELKIERVPCADDMSGTTYEAGATLKVGTQVYRGCGAFLDD